MLSVVDLVLDVCQCSPDSVAIEMVGVLSDFRHSAITYRELAVRVENGAQSLRKYLGATTKFCERCISILDSDCVESVLLQLSLMKLGFSFINVSKSDDWEMLRSTLGKQYFLILAF